MDDSIYIVNDYNSALNIVNGIIKFLIQVKQYQYLIKVQYIDKEED